MRKLAPRWGKVKLQKKREGARKDLPYDGTQKDIVQAIAIPQPEGFPKVTAATRGNTTSIEFATDKAAQKYEHVFRNSQSDQSSAFYFEGHKLRAMLDEDTELRSRKPAMHGIREAFNVMVKKSRFPRMVKPI